MMFYRLLLRLYPASFRKEYGQEMLQVVADRHRDASGIRESLEVAADAVWDALTNGFAAHWDIFRQDVRYTARTLLRSPGFAVAVLLVTALGIGANTAVFSVADRVLVRPLPFPDSDRLVTLWERLPRYSRHEVSPANYRDMRRQASVFDSMAAFHAETVNLSGYGDPVRLVGTSVIADIFPMLGVEPLLGRVLLPDDRPETLILSYGLWQGVFGGDPNVVGRQVRLDRGVYDIVGVMPEAFRFPDRRSEFWSAPRFTEEEFFDPDRDNNYLRVLAKLPPGVSLEDARSHMAVIAANLERAYPEENANTGITVNRWRDEISSQARLLLLALAAASACLLLITCINLANLLLARAIDRRKELTVRTAIGGGRERLVRQMLTENLMLALVGGALGVVVASVGAPVLTRLVPQSLPIATLTTVDLRVLVFAMALTLTMAIGFAAVPARSISRRIDLTELREGARAGHGARRERLRSMLVVAQLTASVMLLISVGLLTRALWRVEAVDPGFETEGVLAIHTPLPISQYAVTERRADFYARVLDEVRARPEVTNAAFVSFLPMVMRGGIFPVEVPGVPEEGNRPTASLRFVTPDFFATLGIPLARGRDVRDTDTMDSPFVAVVSEAFVRRHWPEVADPIGQRFYFAFRERTIAGVVGDIRVRGLERESEPQVYLPYRQVPDGGLYFYAPKELVIRTSASAETLLPVVRQALVDADPALPVAEVRTLDSIVEGETASRAAQIRVIASFAALSMLLSGLGIYGLLSFAVSSRRAEIGVRMALGASSSDVLIMISKHVAYLAVVGVALGLLLAFGAGRAMEALLFGVEPADLPTFVTAAVLAVLTAVAGSLVPALRALAVDPTTAIDGA